MRLPRIVLVVSVVAAVLSIAAALFAAHRESLMCGVVALAALAGHVTVIGRLVAPPVRWALIAGIALLTATTAARLFWYETTSGASTVALLIPSDDLNHPMMQRWRILFDRDRHTAVGQLFGVSALAAAVLALPEHHRRGRAVDSVRENRVLARIS